MRTPLFRLLIAASLAFAGCSHGHHQEASPEPEVAGDTVTIPTNAPQCAALTVEPAGQDMPQSVRFTGRLVWDENVTARVFTPFAGIVRNVRAEVNDHIAKNQPLAE